MPIGEICNREVVIVQRDTAVGAAARLMRQHHVGALSLLAEELSELSALVSREQDKELHARR